MASFSGTARNSRLEYRSLNGRYKNDYDFQIAIKTMADEGIIFYTSDLTNQNLIAVYINEGKVKCRCSIQNLASIIMSGNWYRSGNIYSR